MVETGKPGDVLGGRYRLLTQLGVGGMARVWRAEHVATHAPLAIKIIDPEITSIEFNLARFLREAKTLKTLDSPHLVKVIDYGADADTAFLVMELLTGETLGSRLEQRGRLPFDEAKGILRDVCAAMSLVHERALIHRDLKPDNIFLCTGGAGVAKVVDFGISKPVAERAPSFSTRTGYVLGTPAYMSPEQCRGLRDIDRRSDLWSIGVIAYECLVGREPFRADTLAELLLKICMDPPPVPSEQFAAEPSASEQSASERAAALPAGFDAWFAKAVARERAERFQSADELCSAFLALKAPAIRTARLVALRPGASEAPRRPPLESTAAPKPAVERSTPFGLGVVVRGKLEPRIKWSAAAALALLLVVGAWQLLRLLGPRATAVGIDALRPEAAPAAASSARRSHAPAPSPEPRTPAPEGMPASPPPAPAPSAWPEPRTTAPDSVPASPPSAAPEPSASPEPRATAPGSVPSSPPSAAPAGLQEASRALPTQAPAPSAPPQPPPPARRRAPASDIRRSR